MGDPAAGHVDPATKLKLDNGLQATALQTGTTAEKRLLERTDSRQMFHYETGGGGLFYRLRRYGWPTLRYLTQTEVHTYAFSVAANSILSLFPLIVLNAYSRSPGLSLAAEVPTASSRNFCHDFLPSNQDS